MDPFDYPGTPIPPRKTSALVWNVLTILLLVTILCILSIFLLIYVDPNTSINPFPPPTLIPTIALPTETITPRFTLIPSWTPTQGAPGMVSNLQATPTGEPTSMPTSIPPKVVEPTLTPPPGGFAFVAQQGSPSAIEWTVFHPDAGCDWSGIAGQATSLNGESVQGLFVQLGGTLDGSDKIDKLTMTGLANEYGPGGFEFILSNDLVASTGTLWI
jgi:hypothetical protein